VLITLLFFDPSKYRGRGRLIARKFKFLTLGNTKKCYPAQYIFCRVTQFNGFIKPF
jgi:hypothetical protein